LRQSPFVGLILLQGDLGAGKTTLTKGIAQALQLPDLILSPTYTIVRPYQVSVPEIPIKSFIHVDLYRIQAAWEIEELNLRELIAEPQTLVVIEWPEKGQSYWSETPHISISLTYGESMDERIITIINHSSS
jgi:tRNA threonylcarbamoyladenosine biosynthesis protein TsaE